MKLAERIQAATEPFVLERNVDKEALRFIRRALKTTKDSDPFTEKPEEFKTYHADGRACARRVYEELGITENTGNYDDDSLYFETSDNDPDKDRKEAFLVRAAYNANQYYANPTQEVRAEAFPQTATALTSAERDDLHGKLEQIFDYLKARRIRRFVRALELDLTTAERPIDVLRTYGKQAAMLGLCDYVLERREQLLTK